MTRKDYLLIAQGMRRMISQQARALQDKLGNAELEAELLGMLAMVLNVAETLQEDNPAFDKERFKEASGWFVGMKAYNGSL